MLATSLMLPPLQLPYTLILMLADFDADADICSLFHALPMFLIWLAMLDAAYFEMPRYLLFFAISRVAFRRCYCLSMRERRALSGLRLFYA